MMTKEMMRIDEGGMIYFDCQNHAEKKDVCIICSTLANVLLCACRRCGIEPVTDEDGHLTITVDKAEYPLIETFRAVQDVYKEAADQFPWYLKIY